MNKIIAILTTMALSGFCFGARCLAQQTIDQEPIVHTVNFPKGDAAWNVTFEAELLPGQPPPPQPKLSARYMQKINIVRKGDLRHDVLAWSDGGTTDYWWSESPAFVLYQDGTGGRILVMKSGNMGGFRYDETFFTWISKDTFAGMKTFQNKKCRLYQMSIVLPNLEKVTERAWIDNKTSKPVGWSESGILSIFSFDVPLPPEPLVMPQNFRKELNRMQSFFVLPKRNN